MTYVRNAWYVAVASSELADKPIARTILDVRMVLYRTLAGREPVALADRCPHRFLPLSKGRVVQDGLQCGYHGLVYGEAGQCIHVPTQDEIPANAKVRSFPVREAYGFVWVWPGDPELADAATLPVFAEPTGLAHHLSADWASAWGYYHPSASWMLVVDNLLDLSHVTLVHTSTLAAGGFDSASINVTVEGHSVIDSRVARGIRAGEAFGPIFGSADALIDYWLEIHWCAPSTLLLEASLPRAGEDKFSGARFLATQIITPETAGTSHYYWVSSRNYAVSDDALTESWRQMVEFAFTEDADILAAQQREIGAADIMDLKPALLKVDRSDVQARRIVKRLQAAEQ